MPCGPGVIFENSSRRLKKPLETPRALHKKAQL
jgi:hypothetical protein